MVPRIFEIFYLLYASLSRFLRPHQVARASHRTETGLFILIVVVSITMPIITINRQFRFHSSTNAETQATVNPSPTPVRVQAEQIVIRSIGFLPNQISRPAGKFLLTVRNRSDRQNLTLRLDKDDGTRLREAQINPENSVWRELVLLTPGTYLLTEASHSDWVCRIIITSNNQN